jgi:hypothetical protein
MSNPTNRDNKDITSNWTGTINLNLRIKPQPAINLKKLLKLKPNIIRISTIQKPEIKDFNK